MILIPVLLFTVGNKLNFKEVFRLNKLGLLPAAIIILAAIPAIYAAGMFNSIFLYFFQALGDIPNDSVPIPQSILQLITGILVIGISPAICEESLHRGILLKAYEKRGSLKAVVISAIMFGFFHFDLTNLFSPIFLGILIGYYVLRTNSIFAGVLAHFIHNSILEVMGFLYRNEPVSSKITITAAELGQNVILGLLGLVLIFLLLKLFRKVTGNSAHYYPTVSNVKNDIKSIMSHWPIFVSLILYIFNACLIILTMITSKFIR
jgi:uncharacterized protein